MIDEPSLALAIGLVAAVVFATRIAGALFMSWITPSARVDRFLDGLAVSVIAALVASMMAGGGATLSASVLVALLTMILSRSVVWALLAGMTFAAG